MIYTTEEILSEHDYQSPNRMAGYLLHGGLDGEGNYISPRTKIRWQAVNEWTEVLNSRGHELLDSSVEILAHENFPTMDQAKLLLNKDEGQFLWNSLTITGIIEARGRVLAEVTAPDFQEIIVEDISDTCIAHMNKGLFIAHGFDEGGNPDSDQGAHDQMWFAARDLLFGEDAYPIPDVPDSIGRPEEGREMPDLPAEYEGILQLLMQVLMIEIRAESFFSYCMNLTKSEDVFMDKRDDALLACEMISRIRQDEAIHVAYLNLLVSELRTYTFKTLDGKEKKGSEIIDPFWKKMIQWHGEEVHKESVAVRTEEFAELFKRMNDEVLLQEFNELSSNKELYSIHQL